MTNTRARSQEIFNAAVAIVQTFGIKRLDAMPTAEAKGYYVAFKHQLVAQTSCHVETARKYIAKAARRLRSPDWQPAQRGGNRAGAGRPPKPV